MKNYRKFFPFLTALVVFFALGTSAQAQLYVEPSGEVGIGTTSPSAKLDIYNTGTSTYRAFEANNYYSGSSYKYGMYSYVSSAGTSGRYGLYNVTYGPSGNTSAHRGIYNYGYTYTSSTAYGHYNYLRSYGGNGARYGIYNYLNCSSGDGTGTRYALYSGTNCSSGYAGYFAGNVYVAGSITTTSDASKKTNVSNLEGALDKVKQLQPKTYDYIADENLNLPSERQIGFIAQELEEVFPDLVKDIEVLGAPEEGEEGEMGDPTVEGNIKSVNYIGMIPVLVEAIQEQQEIIEAQAAAIEKLQQQVGNK